MGERLDMGGITWIQPACLLLPCRRRYPAWCCSLYFHILQYDGMSSNHCVLLLLLPLLLLLLLLQAEISCMVLQFVSEDITQFEDRGGEISFWGGG